MATKYVPYYTYNKHVQDLKAADEKISNADAAVSSAKNDYKKASAYAKDVKNKAQADLQGVMNTANALEREFGKETEAVLAKIEQMNVEFNRRIRTVSDELRRTNARIDNVQAQTDALAKDIQRYLNSIKTKELSDRQRALVYFRQLEGMAKQISGLFPDKFFPERAESAHGALLRAQADLEASLPEAAIAVLQNNIGLAAVLIAELIAANEEFNAAAKAANDAYTAAARCGEQLSRPAENIRRGEGDPGFVFDGKIDFWTQGQLSKTIEEIENMHARMQFEYDPDKNTGGMVYATQVLNDLYRALQQCVSAAKTQALESFRSVQYAQTIRQAMEKQLTWILQKEAFLGDDARNPYEMVFGTKDLFAIFCVFPDQINLQIRNRIVNTQRVQLLVTDESVETRGCRDTYTCGLAKDGLAVELQCDSIFLENGETEVTPTDSVSLFQERWRTTAKEDQEKRIHRNMQTINRE